MGNNRKNHKHRERVHADHEHDIYEDDPKVRRHLPERDVDVLYRGLSTNEQRVLLRQIYQQNRTPTGDKLSGTANLMVTGEFEDRAHVTAGIIQQMTSVSSSHEWAHHNRLARKASEIKSKFDYIKLNPGEDLPGGYWSYSGDGGLFYNKDGKTKHIHVPWYTAPNHLTPNRRARRGEAHLNNGRYEIEGVTVYLLRDHPIVVAVHFTSHDVPRHNNSVPAPDMMATDTYRGEQFQTFFYFDSSRIDRLHHAIKGFIPDDYYFAPIESLIEAHPGREMRKRINRSLRAHDTLNHCSLMLSGDIESNPGPRPPGPKQPKKICSHDGCSKQPKKGQSKCTEHGPKGQGGSKGSTRQANAAKAVSASLKATEEQNQGVMDATEMLLGVDELPIDKTATTPPADPPPTSTDEHKKKGFVGVDYSLRPFYVDPNVFPSLNNKEQQDKISILHRKHMVLTTLTGFLYFIAFVMLLKDYFRAEIALFEFFKVYLGLCATLIFIRPETIDLLRPLRGVDSLKSANKEVRVDYHAATKSRHEEPALWEVEWFTIGSYYYHLDLHFFKIRFLVAEYTIKRTDLIVSREILAQNYQANSANADPDSIATRSETIRRISTVDIHKDHIIAEDVSMATQRYFMLLSWSRVSFTSDFRRARIDEDPSLSMATGSQIHGLILLRSGITIHSQLRSFVTLLFSVIIHLATLMIADPWGHLIRVILLVLHALHLIGPMFLLNLLVSCTAHALRCRNRIKTSLRSYVALLTVCLILTLGLLTRVRSFLLRIMFRVSQSLNRIRIHLYNIIMRPLSAWATLKVRGLWLALRRMNAMMSTSNSGAFKARAKTLSRRILRIIMVAIFAPLRISYMLVCLVMSSTRLLSNAWRWLSCSARMVLQRRTTRRLKLVILLICLITPSALSLIAFSELPLPTN